MLRVTPAPSRRRPARGTLYPDLAEGIVTMLVGLMALAAVFVICAWSGKTLALHHQDGREVAAVVAIGACVLLSLAFGRNLLESGGPLPLLGLAIVAAGGLFVGYDRADRLR